MECLNTQQMWKQPMEAAQALEAGPKLETAELLSLKGLVCTAHHPCLHHLVVWVRFSLLSAMGRNMEREGILAEEAQTQGWPWGIHGSSGRHTAQPDPFPSATPVAHIQPFTPLQNLNRCLLFTCWGDLAQLRQL